jgi:glycosyltransferase involved in cell wall biosynthesis
MDSIRVAALIDTFEVSGPGRQLVAIASCLRRHHVEMRLILFRRGGNRAPFERFVEDAGVPYEVVTDSGRFDLRVVSRVKRILSEWNPHIVQTHNYRPGAIAFALRQLGASWRWVGFFHGLTAEDAKVHVYHWFDRRFLRHADRVVIMSETQRPLFGACGHKVERISNAVLPAPAAAQGDAEHAASLVSGLRSPRFGVIARLSHEKGVDLFLEALRLLGDRGIPSSAVIAGDGPEMGRLESLAESLGLSDDVRFLGTVDPIESLYRCIDVVVLPSRSEGLPNVLLEALRAQCRVVATRVGAVSEVVRDPLAAHLVEPGSPELLADAMRKTSGAPLSRDAIDAQQAILKRYSIERRRDAHLALYRELAGSESPA